MEEDGTESHYILYHRLYYVHFSTNISSAIQTIIVIPLPSPSDCLSAGRISFKFSFYNLFQYVKNVACLSEFREILSRPSSKSVTQEQ